ncbi:Small conductance mechanosensitive channel OS=Ureibacillus acetophenoni OX=614649 GN=SAMN05877842_105196 PE=3 SV=1 [Ureibacillus acetophenoni]
MVEENIITDPGAFARMTEHFWNYLKSEELWNFITNASVKIISILLLSYLVIFIGKRIIKRILFTKSQNSD